MAMYVLLMTLTPAGRAEAAADPARVAAAEHRVNMPDVDLMGLYGVLGPYDFVGIVEAEDNERAARFSLALGVEAGVHVVTMPAIPIARLEGSGELPAMSVELDVPGA
ncbi:MAG: GYD domain-containing protein [Dehalococcoidia bacterium]